jgi:hypothetical protein
MLTQYTEIEGKQRTPSLAQIVLQDGNSSNPILLLIHGLPSQVRFCLLIAYFFHD